MRTDIYINTIIMTARLELVPSVVSAWLSGGHPSIPDLINAVRTLSMRIYGKLQPEFVMNRVFELLVHTRFEDIDAISLHCDIHLAHDYFGTTSDDCIVRGISDLYDIIHDEPLWQDAVELKDKLRLHLNTCLQLLFNILRQLHITTITSIRSSIPYISHNKPNKYTIITIGGLNPSHYQPIEVLHGSAA